MLKSHILLAVIVFQATNVAHSAAIPRFVHAPNATPPARLAIRDVTSVQTIVTTVTKPVATAVVDKHTSTVTSFSFGPRVIQNPGYIASVWNTDGEILMMSNTNEDGPQTFTVPMSTIIQTSTVESTRTTTTTVPVVETQLKTVTLTSTATSTFTAAPAGFPIASVVVGWIDQIV